MFGHRFPNVYPSCGIYMTIQNDIRFLPIVSLDVHTSIVASTSRTVLTQTFATGSRSFKNVKYVFPLHDGVSVVGFKCTMGSRVIKGVVKEREEAKQEYQNAVASGKMAGLLEQSLEASDVFTTSLGNIPRRAETVKVEITYLGELKHDAQVDGLRFTIPTKLTPRYGQHSIATGDTFQGGKHINITIDADVSSGSAIRSIQSPSHLISVNIGTLSTATSAPPSLQRAHATLSQGSAELDKDFIIQIVATGLGDPMAVLETHPTIPNQRALMTTLVPRFNLPMEMTEVVFLCDRSGSMGQKILNLVAALNIFLKSLPVGVKFNICSFGSHHSFLWDRSMSYGEETLEAAIQHINGFGANFGGTEMYRAIEDVFNRRYKDLNLEVFLLTDGEIWRQEQLFQLINANVAESRGAIRVFTLGVGADVSHALVEGVARAGNGFAQVVGDNEKMDKMLIRMLKGALTPHISDYSLEIKYSGNEWSSEETGDDFEVIEKVMDAMTLEVPPMERIENGPKEVQQPISLFDQSVQDVDLQISIDFNSVKEKLPPLAAPRYLQAPFEIPPLFPFNRTSVYVLLSDSTPDRQPKSVILRGTSIHGPLSLEIPVATLTEKGTTLHQLAARKATRELEDGRGWIFNAKSQDGELLQQKFDGQFGDMVKREAVRLGTQYQVSGKWSSFVAIQDVDTNANRQQEDEEKMEDQGQDGDSNGEEAADFEEISHDEFAFATGPSSRRASRLTRGSRGGRTAALVTGSARPRDRDIASMGMSLQGTPMGAKRQRIDIQQQAIVAQQQAIVAQRQAQMVQVGSSPCNFSAAMPHGRSLALDQQAAMFRAQQSAQQSAQHFAQQQSFQQSSLAANKRASGTSQPPSGFGGGAATGGLFGSSSANTGGGLFGNTTGIPYPNPFASSAAPDAGGGLFGSVSTPMPAGCGAPAAFGSSATTAFGGSGMFGNIAMSMSSQSHLARSSATPPGTGLFGSSSTNNNNDPLSTLSSLQTFAGNWQWNASLEAVLGFTALTVQAKIQLPGNYTQDLDVLATLCAVVFLKKRLASEKDSWELLVQKAEVWLSAQTGPHVLQLEKEVEDKLFTN